MTQEYIENGTLYVKANMLAYNINGAHAVPLPSEYIRVNGN